MKAGDNMTVLLVLMMVVVGALIGGMTNHLAIKMLFKPYKAKYIGRFQLPFTPGLIPKRQEELAEQLGYLVTSHLVTQDALKEKLVSPSFNQQVTEAVSLKYDEWCESEKRTIDLLNNVKSDWSAEQIEANLTKKIAEQLRHIYDREQTKTLHEILPDQLTQTIDESLPQATRYLLEQVDQYVNSREGQRKISEAGASFLQSQGFLGNMVSNYLGEEGLVEKITPAINQFIRSDDTHETVETMLRAEWHKWQHLDLASMRHKLLHDQIEDQMANYIVNELDIRKYLHEPVSTWLKTFEYQAKHDIIPNLVTLMLNQIAAHLETIMKQIDLSQMVEKQVSQFDVKRLEKMVLDISRRELKMITYLGALLGGTIGLVQGLIVIFVG